METDMINTTVLKTVPRGAAPTNPVAARVAAPIRTEIVHHVPGRLRLRSASLHRNAPASVAARRRLRHIDGVTAVTANSCTGSLLIEYDRTRLSLDDLRRLLGRHGYVVAGSSQVEGGRSPLAEVSRLLGRLAADAFVERIVVLMLQAIV
jgi:hypothetical protein